MDKIKKNISLIILIFLIIPIILPFLNKGYFPMHDDTQPTRVFEMAQALRDGQFPVRWVSDLGYGFGYPIFNFYAPLPYYFGSLWVISGFDVIVSTKLMFIFPIILSGISMFFLAQKLWNKKAALLAAILFVYAPYHAVQIFVRGAVGEYWAYAFLPLVFLGIINLQDSKRRGMILGALGLVGVILSHNITALILFGFLGIWLVIELFKFFFWKKPTNYFISIIKVTLLGLMLSTFFWLPAILEAKFTQVANLGTDTNDFHQHFVYVDQLWNSPWGFAGSAPGRLDGMSFMIGKIHIILVAIAFLLLLYKVLFKKIYSGKFLLIFLGATISILMLLSISTKLWEILPYSNYIQYPWRFLVFVMFFLSLLTGYIWQIHVFQQKKITNFIFYIIILLIIIYNERYFQPQYIYSAQASDYISQTNMMWKISKISDEYLPLYFPVPKNPNQSAVDKIITSNDIIINELDTKSNHWLVDVTVKKTSNLVFSLAYFPGWKTYLDNIEVVPKINNGIININIPEGRHRINLIFSDTWVRIIGNIISLIGIIWLIVLSLTKAKSNNHIYG